MTHIVSIGSTMTVKQFITRLNKTKGRVHVWSVLGKTNDGQPIGAWVWCSKKDVKDALATLPDTAFIKFRSVSEDDALFIRL